LAARIERSRPVRRGDRDDDARLADLDSSQPVVDRDGAEAVPLRQLVAGPRELRRTAPTKLATAPASGSSTSRSTDATSSGPSTSRNEPPLTGGMTAT